ncbi:hypothetical protein E6C48_03100 [Mesorhizobium composti]|uniref:Uncharacterized protein n=1 Tax=Ollibium composti TaxID=2675109 RepID=A0ABY2QDN9_9HYPH|nr:hypothetical protein E6C48_03100 [Mesorhizobium composti]
MARPLVRRYTSSMIGKSLSTPFPLAAILIFAMVPAAFAAGTAKRPTQTELPGVQGDYRIVRPAPEPDDDAASAPTGQFKIGDMDVRIGGSVTIDIGVGSLPRPRR